MHLFDVSIAGEINLDQILYGIPREIPLEREIPATGYAVTLGSSRVIRKGEGATTGTRESLRCPRPRAPVRPPGTLLLRSRIKQ